jgi:hypothetical protein
MNRVALARVLNAEHTPAVTASPASSEAGLQRARLWALLDRWTTLPEDAWTRAAVDQLRDEILDVFTSQPEADAWFREWRAAHPEARLV